MFIDRVKIHIQGGHGGNGVTAFRREKFVPRGGPSGGDGGRGGDVLIVADESLNTLLHLRYNPLHIAKRGLHGEGSNRSGSEGDEFELQLELKLLADVGLLGFPNAGKSTFISTVSAAKPKIADYPFTTLEPHLGVVDLGDFRTFVIADIPGLIEGAHEGHGLGDRFLLHVERTTLLLHLVDVSSASGRDPVSDYEIINHELAAYDAQLAARDQIVVATKIDALDEPARLAVLKDRAMSDGRPFFPISSVTGEGVRELIRAVANQVEQHRKEKLPRAIATTGDELLVGSSRF